MLIAVTQARRRAAPGGPRAGGTAVTTPTEWLMMSFTAQGRRCHRRQAAPRRAKHTAAGRSRRQIDMRATTGRAGPWVWDQGSIFNEEERENCPKRLGGCVGEKGKRYARTTSVARTFHTFTVVHTRFTLDSHQRFTRPEQADVAWREGGPSKLKPDPPLG
jgi:hypothetical protein